jgi:AcrR family transcriptional regulator
MADGQTGRRRAANDRKRGLILDAAQRVFEREGLQEATIRQIAADAGYTAGAIYFYFASKEEIYAEVLERSLGALRARVDAAAEETASPVETLRAAALAFFDYYVDHPRDLDLGFYLYRGGLRPYGLGAERDRALNRALEASLAPIADAARALGASEAQARVTMTDAFAHASGVLLLAHTRRIRMFGVPPRRLMERYLDAQIAALVSETA